jgi:glycopeptide antibiotics resistance protein
MIATLLIPSSSVGMTVLAAFAILGPLVAWWLASHRRIAGVLAALAVVPVLLLTLSPTQRSMTFGCAIDWSPQLTAAEPLANVLLFVPCTLALAVAIGRPVRALAAGTGLSLAIELVQAVVTPIGRSCDTSDWIANTAGAVIGACVAAIGMALARWQRGTAVDASRGAGTDTVPVARR